MSFQGSTKSLLVVAIGAASLYAGQASAMQCAEPVNLASPVLSSGFAINHSNTRNAVSNITSSNVSQLALNMSVAADGWKEKRGAPALTSETIYFAAGNEIVAADRETGCEHWRAEVDSNYGVVTGKNFARSSAVLFIPATDDQPAVVAAGDAFGNAYVFRADTGAVVWKAFVGNDTKYSMITGGIQSFDGKLLIPVATKEVITAATDITHACCSSHGMLRLVDLYTGETIWDYQATPDAIYDWSRGKRGPAGVSIWGTPAIDSARNRIYVPTGQNLVQPATDNSDSILSLDMTTGEVKWIFQSTANDVWNAACQAPSGLDSACDRPEGGDFDFGAPPIMTTVNGEDVILAGAKNGVVYSLNPEDGSLNWMSHVGVGGSLGGIHWGMAIDDTKLYVANTDIYVNKLSGNDLLAGVESIANGMDLVDGATPGIYALDKATGARIWEIHPTRTYEGEENVPVLYSAGLTVTNDVLFAGSLSGEIAAFNTANGDKLWSADTAQEFIDINGVVGNGGTIDSVGQVVSGDDVYVNSGYRTFGTLNKFQAGAGNMLLNYRLGATEPTPPEEPEPSNGFFDWLFGWLK